ATAPFAALGMLFQMQDDVLDLYGDKGRDKLGSDLYEGKISALVVAHLECVPEDRERLLALLREPRATTSEADVLEMIARFRDRGAKQRVLTDIRAEARDAQNLAERLPAAHKGLGPLLDDLIALVLTPIAHLGSA